MSTHAKSGKVGKADAALTTALSGWQHNINIGTWSRVALLFTHTNSSATAVNVQLSRSYDGSTYYPDQRVNSSNEFEDDLVSKVVSGDDTFAVLIDVSDTPYLRVEATRTGGSASDTLAVDVTGGSGA